MKLSDVRRIIREELEAAVVEASNEPRPEEHPAYQEAFAAWMKENPGDTPVFSVGEDGSLYVEPETPTDALRWDPMARNWVFNEARAIRKSKRVLKENIGFATPRNPGLLPESYEQFRASFKYAFQKMNLQQLAGRTMNLNESNSVLDGLERMWATVEREMNGNLGMPAPAFKEGREFWSYFANELEGDLARVVESNLQGSKLVKGNSLEVARAVLDVLKAGS